MAGMSERLVKVYNVLKKKKNTKCKALELECGSSAGKCTQSLVEQLEEATDVTHLTLHDSLQRPDNVPLFAALKKLLKSEKCKLQDLRLIEPRVHSVDYKRWCFKRTGFLHHCYQICKDRDIHLAIDATLILETPEGKSQDISSWLLTHFPKTIRQDQDLTSIDCHLTSLPGEKQIVQDVFRALCDLFSNCKRRWKSIQIHVLYGGVPRNALPLTDVLMEVAEIYRVPLIVEWNPIDITADSSHGSWSRMTLAAQYKMLQQQNSGGSWLLPPAHGFHKALEDNTCSTVELDHSSLSFH